MVARSPALRVATIVALGLCIWLAQRYAVSTPRVVPAGAAATEFSAERALRHLHEIARAPHPVSSVEHDRVRDYLVRQVEMLGLPVEVQEATGVGTRYAEAGRVWNVVTRVRGTSATRHAVLLAAHYDGVPAGPAAADDGAGTAMLLETLRALKAGPPVAHDVIALFADGEEPGLLGAAAFVRDHPAARDVAVMMNFEARGTNGPSLMFETGAGNLDVVRVLRAAGGARATSLSTAVYRRLPNDTDLSELALLGRPALNFAFIGGVNRYHTTQDDVAHLDQRSLQHHGEQALALARAFGNGELPRPATGDAVFFDLPGVGVVVYPEGWSLPLAILALVLVALAALRSRRAGRFARDVAIGVPVVLVSLPVAALAAMGAATLFDRIHLAIGSGTPMWSAIYATAIAALAVSVTTLAYAALRRTSSATGIRAAALICCALLTLGFVVVAPGASFLLLWPLLFAAAAMLVETFVDGGPRGVASAAAWISAVVTLFLFVPTTYLMVCVALGVVGTGAIVLGVLTALATWLLAPQLETLRPTVPDGQGPWRSWATPIASLGLAIVLAAAGALTVRTSDRDPAGGSLQYVVEADSGRAWLTASATTPAATARLAREIRRVRAPGETAPVPAWVRSRFDTARVAKVPPAPVGAPTVSVVSDSMLGGARRVVLRVLPGAPGAPAATPLRAYSVSMSMPRDAVISADVDGRAIDTTRYRSRPPAWRLEYFAPADSGFELALLLRPAAERVMDIATKTLGIPALPGVQLPVFSDGVIPIQMGRYTTAHRRIRF